MTTDAAAAPATRTAQGEEWLLEESASPYAHKVSEAPERARDDTGGVKEAEIERLRGEFERRENELEQTLRQREAEFAQGLREVEEAFEDRRARLESEVRELESEVSALGERLEAREAELERAAQRAEDLEARITELETATTPEPSPGGLETDGGLDVGLETDDRDFDLDPETEHGTLDVNRVTFEQLRDLGLSVTQSARILAHRDTRRGFESLDELDGVAGLPTETRARLRTQLRV